MNIEETKQIDQIIKRYINVDTRIKVLDVEIKYSNDYEEIQKLEQVKAKEILFKEKFQELLGSSIKYIDVFKQKRKVSADMYKVTTRTISTIRASIRLKLLPLL